MKKTLKLCNTEIEKIANIKLHPKIENLNFN